MTEDELREKLAMALAIIGEKELEITRLLIERGEPELRPHEWARTQPTDGRWCQRCGLSEARWIGTDCDGDARAALRMLDARLAQERNR